MKRSTLVIFLAVALVSVIAGIVYSRKSQVGLSPVKVGPIQEAVYGLGKVKSNSVYELKLGVISSILELFVKEGDQVKKGQKLVRFDDMGLARAPFAGTVTYLPFHESENVFPQSVVLRIEDLNNLYVEVALEQQGALRVRKGQQAKLSLESLRGSVVQGVVESVFPKDDQFVVRVKAKMFQQEVLPGMTADVVIIVGEKTDALLVPVASISNGRLTLVREGKKQKVEVKIGVVDGDWAEVLEGDVRRDDQIVVPKRRS